MVEKCKYVFLFPPENSECHLVCSYIANMYSIPVNNGRGMLSGIHMITHVTSNAFHTTGFCDENPPVTNDPPFPPPFLTNGPINVEFE